VEWVNPGEGGRVYGLLEKGDREGSRGGEREWEEWESERKRTRMSGSEQMERQ
jgi:hypothetical protein